MLSVLGRKHVQPVVLRLSSSTSLLAIARTSYHSVPKAAAQSLSLRKLATIATNATPACTDAIAKAQELLKRVAQLQVEIGEKEAAWVRRVGADLEGGLRIAVIGEQPSETALLVNSLLENPLKEGIQSGNRGVRRISYGPTSEVLNSASSGFHDIKYPADWLLKNGVEIYEIPGFDALSKDQMQDVIYRSDLIIFVTDVSRRLTSPEEREFLQNFYVSGKHNFIFVVDGLEREGKQTVEVLDEVRERTRSIAPLQDKSVASVVPVNTHTARSAQELLRSKKPPAIFAERWSKSGLQDLKAAIIARVDTPADRTNQKVQSATFTAKQALHRLVQSQTAADKALARARDEVKQLADKLAKTEKRLARDFEVRDLAVVQYSVSSLGDAVREYFDKVKFWKLFWRSDFVADDLKAKMRENSLLQAEYQMVYAVGKLNEGLFHLYEGVREHMDRLAAPSQADINQAGAPTQALQHDIRRIQKLIEQQAPPNAGSEVDPFFLRNEIAKFDETRQCDDLQNQAEKLVRRQATYQLLLYTSALLGVHLGVPFAVMAPTALSASISGLGWMKLRWSSLEGRFWGRVSEGHKTLTDRLMTAYEHEFNRVVAEPLVSIIRLTEEAIEGRRKEVQNNIRVAEDALKSAQAVETRS